ncbi:MAG: alkaline phosphatase family protein, partial [Candidatus Omnitrophota bacterium]
MSSKPRVIVIGLDGATFKIIAPLVKKGRLPNFKRLMQEASFGPLQSTIPPITPCAWISFATGKDPSKHGLYDFKHHEGDPENKKAVNSTFVKAKSLWELLSEARKRCIVIYVPCTYPPEEINGILISRILAPSNKNCTYPKSLYYTLRKRGFIEEDESKIFEQHADDADKRGQVKDLAKRPIKLSKEQIRKTKEHIEKMHNAARDKIFKKIEKDISKGLILAKELLKKEDWDFFMVVFMAADNAGHGFWYNQTKVRIVYEKLDRAVGELFDLAGKDTITFIMSDHGFTSIPYACNINEWLFQKGLLFKKFEPIHQESRKELKAVLKKIRIGTLGRNQNKFTKFHCRLKTDYARSKVYLQSRTSYGLRINLAGRENKGVVRRQDYEPLREYLIKELKKMRDPTTGKRIFSHILKKEDIYSVSPFSIAPAPDIFLLAKDTRFILEGKVAEGTKIFAKTFKNYGFHCSKGIFFAHGNNIKATSLKSVKITDLTPTILHILNVPLPEDLDGRVLREIFEPHTFYRKKKICYQNP